MRLPHLNISQELAHPHGAASAIASVSATHLSAGAASPGEGCCDWTTPLPVARTIKPAAVARALAARASSPRKSGTPEPLAAGTLFCENAASSGSLAPTLRTGMVGGTLRYRSVA